MAPIYSETERTVPPTLVCDSTERRCKSQPKAWDLILVSHMGDSNPGMWAFLYCVELNQVGLKPTSMWDAVLQAAALTAMHNTSAPHEVLDENTSHGRVHWIIDFMFAYSHAMISFSLKKTHFIHNKLYYYYGYLGY